MPTISTFHGIDVKMFWGDHNPPHFHAYHAGEQVLIDIRTLEIIRGAIARRALILVLEWARDHRAELIEDWVLCSSRQPPKPINPLP